MRLKSKKYVDNIDFAYDIEVEDNHNYIANGLIVHNCKNPASLQGKALFKLETKYMAALSGTPLMNRPFDLFVPLKWLGFESHSYFQFCHYYGVYGGFNNSEVVGYKNLDTLRNLVSSVMLRRVKTEVLDLPEKIQKTEYVEMKTKQAKLYSEVLSKIKTNIQKVNFSNNPLSMLIRLRQVTGWTGILSETIQESAKMDRLQDLVYEIVRSQGKAVIFSNWSEVTKVAKDILAKYNPAYITGDTQANERMLQVQNFQTNENCKVIIGTIGAMGTGLTLTAAQNVIFLDSPWNRALKDQAEDRCHRIGTTGTVNVITLVCKNTIDERIETLIRKKGQMSDALIDGKLNAKDIEFLLS